MARHVRNGWIHQGRLAGGTRFCCLTLSEKLSSHHIPLCLGSFEIVFEIWDWFLWSFLTLTSCSRVLTQTLQSNKLDLDYRIVPHYGWLIQAVILGDWLPVVTNPFRCSGFCIILPLLRSWDANQVPTFTWTRWILTLMLKDLGEEWTWTSWDRKYCSIERIDRRCSLVLMASNKLAHDDQHLTSICLF